MIWFVVGVIYLLIILFVWSLVAVNPRDEDDVSGVDGHGVRGMRDGQCGGRTQT